MKFFKTRKEIYLKAYDKGYKEGVEIITKEKDLEIAILKRNLNRILKTKTIEVERRDIRLHKIERHINILKPFFAEVKAMADGIEEKEETKYVKLSAEYQEVTGFTGKLRLIAKDFEKTFPAIEANIEKYKIDHILE